MADPALRATFRKPFAEQVAAFRLRLGHLAPTARWDDIRGNQHDRAFMVAGAMKADLLADLAAAVEKAITQGTTLETFRKDFRGIVERNGWHGWTGEGTAKGEAWRTKVIYRTNLATSYAAGRRAQLIAGNFKWWVYRHGGSLEPREHHLSWDGVALPPDHPFWVTHAPPNGWGCSCRIFGARTEAGIRRVGGDPAKSLPDNWQSPDPRTGAPVGIDKGWDHAPGATVESDIRDLVRRKADSLPPTLANDLTRELEQPARLPFEDAQPARTVAAARDALLASGATLRVETASGMKLDGINEYFGAVREAFERMSLTPLEWLGPVARYPMGRLRLGNRSPAAYVPRTSMMVFRSTAVDADRVRENFAPKLLSASYQKSWQAGLARTVPEVRERAARMAGDTWAVVDSTAAMAMHEMGHHFHNVHRAAIDAILADNSVVRDGWPFLISKYGRTNAAEYIAESFALYMKGDATQFYRIHPAVLEFYRSKDRLAK